ATARAGERRVPTLDATAGCAGPPPLARAVQPGAAQSRSDREVKNSWHTHCPLARSPPPPTRGPRCLSYSSSPTVRGRSTATSTTSAALLKARPTPTTIGVPTWPWSARHETAGAHHDTHRDRRPRHCLRGADLVDLVPRWRHLLRRRRFHAAADDA